MAKNYRHKCIEYLRDSAMLGDYYAISNTPDVTFPFSQFLYQYHLHC